MWLSVLPGIEPRLGGWKPPVLTTTLKDQKRKKEKLLTDSFYFSLEVRNSYIILFQECSIEKVSDGI